MPAGPRCVVAIAAQKESISGEGTLFLLCFAVGREWRERKARMGGARGVVTRALTTLFFASRCHGAATTAGGALTRTVQSKTHVGFGAARNRL